MDEEHDEKHKEAGGGEMLAATTILIADVPLAFEAARLATAAASNGDAPLLRNAAASQCGVSDNSLDFSRGFSVPSFNPGMIIS